MGKTFIEAVSRLTVPSLLAAYDFSLPDGIDPDSFEYPHNNLTAIGIPDIKVRIKERPQLLTPTTQ